MVVDEDPIATFEAPAAAWDPGGPPIGGAPPRLEPPAGGQVFHVRLATSAGGREAASLLLRKMYAWRGYAFDVSDHHDANKITLYAETGGVLVGTMSVCLDRAAGRGAQLPADENFPDKLDELRHLGRRLAEPSQLAIDKGVSKRVFAALIHISYIYARNIAGFADFGGERACSRVGAPAVLLRLPLDYMAVQIRKWGGSMEQHGEERSFYPYFFPIWDEPGITARLLAGGN
jgi:hypothetical protein